ncbi:protein MAIN-LIKE 2-like [Amaranthus tricolor]|uniref:protein MAIN-LIKE 2-like n=1 Tax=Amaranthus tricolor TaxID=29722 RepID=UPI002590DAA8|nr:protein MAIN-LIKE 2-like [Amaranthus tricolor]
MDLLRATNGQTKRTIQTLEDLLRASVMDFGGSWDDNLMYVDGVLCVGTWNDVNESMELGPEMFQGPEPAPLDCTIVCGPEGRFARGGPSSSAASESHALDTQTTAYYMAVIGSTLLADKTRTGMRPHPIVVVNDDEQDVAWGAVTLAFLYRQLGMASRAGCKTIAGCLTLLQTWIYEYFPAFRPHPRRDDVPNTTRAEMWTPKKVGRELDRLISFRKVLDSMTETQVEWTPYNCGAAALLHEHPRTTVIGGITCFDVVEVYLPERALRQIGFVQSIPPAPMRPAKALRPAHGTYSVTFPSSAAAFVEAWSRFPYSGRLVEQGLRRATVPSETEPNYVEWFRRKAQVYPHQSGCNSYSSTSAIRRTKAGSDLRTSSTRD